MVPQSNPEKPIRNRYCIHILIFLVTLLVGLTLCHPGVLLNDEWITLNQLNQIHAGHQVIISEGKYGMWGNGTPFQYFEAKSNKLGYSVALPLISLPAYWLLDLTGSHFTVLIIVIWTFAAILTLLLLNFSYPALAHIGKFRWTDLAYIGVFGLFFLNLYFYVPFPVSGYGTFAEIIAIAFTNCIMVALIGVMVYEIAHDIFFDVSYAVFSTAVTLACSSYFVWMIGCKDHILTVFICTFILLWLVKYQKTKDGWYLPLVFIFTGLLAWVRPELAFWIFLALCVFYLGIIYNKWKEGIFSGTKPALILCAPLFTLIGALPFFVNNFMVTKNPLIPAWILWDQDLAAPVVDSVSTNGIATASSPDAVHTVTGLFGKMIKIHPDTFLSDILGVLFYPQNGGIGVFPVVPLFLVMSVVIVILLLVKKIAFDEQEKQFIIPLALLAIAIFVAYGIEINSLNTSRGVVPDMRYLLALYVPLNLMGLLFLKKISIITINPLIAIKRMGIFSFFTIPLSLYIVFYFYAMSSIAATFSSRLNTEMALVILLMSSLTIIAIILPFFTKRGENICNYLIPVLCSLPFVWQTVFIFYHHAFSTAQGYTFWFPLVRVFFESVLVKILIS